LDFKTLANSDLLIIHQTFNGFWYNEIFFKCFEIEVRYKEVDYFTILFDQEVFPNKKRPTGTDARTKAYFMLHYPKQLLATTRTFSKYHWSNQEVKVNYKMAFRIKTLKIVTKRNKRSKLCFDDDISYDTFALNFYMKGIGCIPPYLNNTINLPICKEKEQMRKTNMHLLDKKSAPSRLISPCEYIGDLRFDYSERHYGGNGEILSVQVQMPSTFKHVTQTQAIGVESLIGTIGGYMGLFCGK
jgi:hypothetical protein